MRSVRDRAFLDTNILLYAISENPQETEKRNRARALLLRLPCALSVQVCQEFFHQATRSGGRFRLDADQARQALARFRYFPVQDTTIALFDAALAVQDRTGYSIWDALIVAAAQALGCTMLYTEDMQDGRIIDGLRIVNPFRAGAPLP